MKKSLSILQIAILVLGIIAISYAVGSSVEMVSADDPDPNKVLPDEPSSSSTTVAAVAAAVNPAQKTLSKWTLGKSTEEGIGFRGTLSTTGKTTTGTAAETAAQNSAKLGARTLLNNVLIASGIYAAIQFLGPFAWNDKQGIDALSKASMFGYLAYSSIDDIVAVFSKSAGAKVSKFLGGKVLGVAGSVWIGAIVAVGIFLLSYKKTEEIKVQYTCSAWDAPTGGNNCEKCNAGSLPCTEYQCRSLGQACQIINPGTNEERCVWVNEGDVKPPVIKAWEDALLNSDYTYTPDNRISPPDRGVYIKYKGGCIPAFTPFNFGIILDEPAKCKIDTTRKETFKDMNLFFGGSSTLKYNHTQTLTLPSPESLEAENITVKNNGNFELHVICQDANGNPKEDSPSASFVFKYCVAEGPDTTPPLIVSTNIETDSPIAYNQSSVKVEAYINEPASCKWNHDRDTNFDNMEGNFICSSSVFEMNAQMLYKCSTTLTGIKDRQENKFFFRCKDKPTAKQDRNENTQGYEFTIIGTQPLVIDEIGPNETVKDSTDSVKVTLSAKTSAGYKEGEATCYYSQSCFEKKGSKTDYTAFYYAQGTGSYIHSQDLWLSAGTYSCSIKCVDLGGNTDTKETTYTVEVDESPPLITRVYHEDTYLKIITEEEAECVYGISSCNYLLEPDGLRINTVDNKEHFVSWDSDKTYYIKCQDKYGNQPLPNACSIIVRPSEDYN